MQTVDTKYFFNSPQYRGKYSAKNCFWLGCKGRVWSMGTIICKSTLCLNLEK